MDIRVVVVSLVAVVLVAICYATDDADQLLDGRSVETGDDGMLDDKRAKIFRYGRAPGVFRYGKRTPSVFRYGKRAPAVFRYGKRPGVDDDGSVLVLVEPPSEPAGQHKRKIFRWGKRAE